MSSEGNSKRDELCAAVIRKDVEENDEKSREEETAKKEAGCRIQAFLALEAWRLQKQETDDLKFNIRTLSEKAEALEMQRYALRQLLDSEKIRLELVNSDVRQFLNLVDDYKRENSEMKKEKEQLKEQIRDLEEKYAALENDCRNQRNELLTAKLEARSWEKQLEKEREKLSKIKSEKKLSIEDVPDVAEESKEATGVNSKKAPREGRVKNMTCRNTKKNVARGRDIGKIDLAWK